MSGEWRQQVRQAARESAQQEARQLWGLGEDAAIPFEHRWEHVQAVAGLALRLAAELNADGEVVEAAAWLHDVCKMQPNHAAAGARNAELFLEETDFPQEKIPAVASVIAQHEGLYREEAEPLQPIEAAILWDADKLSKLGLQSIIYVVSAPYSAGRSMQARLDDIEEFIEEVLNRTVNSMNTEPAKRLAGRRYADMRSALESWKNEVSEQRNE
jgi:uncharacterized protein